MLTYQYEARNTATGEKVKASVQADNEQTAAKLLKEQGLSPLSIKLDKNKSGLLGFLGKVKSKDKVVDLPDPVGPVTSTNPLG